MLDQKIAFVGYGTMAEAVVFTRSPSLALPLV